GRDVDNGPTREVECTQLEDPATTPDPVGERSVDERRPCKAEDHEGLEALALGEGPGDERRRDDGEHHLEGNERHRRDVTREIVRHDAPQPDEIEAAADAAL